LMHKPQLLYMDEPTVGIDAQNRRRVLDTVLRLREQGVSILYTSHLLEEVQEISDRVAIVDRGVILAMGTVGELIQKVGEEDRLIFDVGDQTVSDALLDKIKTSVDGVTSAAYSQRQIKGEDGTEGAEAIATTTTPSDGIVTVFAKRGRKALPDIIRVANEAGLDILSVAVREPDLEAVFLHLTGRALRD
ncbi:MAG: hypothetical protein ABI700_26725, partial [Chloroflexota bacterium]